jgi:6-phosphogluconolactonase
MSSSSLMFVGTYTKTEPHVAGKAEGIYAYAVDAATGKLSLRGVTAGLENPSFLTLSPSGNYLYAVSEVGEFDGAEGGCIAAYAVDAVNGSLALINQQPSHGIAPCFVSVEATERYLLVSNYGSGVVAMYPLAENGAIEDATCIIQHEGSSINPARQQGPHAHSITVDLANKHAVAADLGMDQAVVYTLDMENGTLVAGEGAAVDVDPGLGPRHFAFHPNHEYGYLIQEIGSAITVFSYDEAYGRLKEIQTLSTLPAAFDPGEIEGTNSTADIHVHPSGRFVYGSNRGHDSIAIFAVDETRGTLSLIGHESTRGRTPRNFALDADGRFLFAANQDTDTIETFAIDAASGLLTHRHSADVPSPVCIKILA